MINIKDIQTVSRYLEDPNYVYTKSTQLNLDWLHFMIEPRFNC